MAEQSPNNQDTQSSLINKVLKVAAYPVGGLTGWWVARNHIRHSTFTKLKAEGQLQDITEPYLAQKKIIHTKMRDAKTPEAKDIVRKEGRKLSKQYTADLRHRFEELGLNEIGEQSREIYKQQYHKALIEGFTAATIVMGGILILANNKTLARAFADDDKDKKEKDGSGISAA